MYTELRRREKCMPHGEDGHGDRPGEQEGKVPPADQRLWVLPPGFDELDTQEAWDLGIRDDPIDYKALLYSFQEHIDGWIDNMWTVLDTSQQFGYEKEFEPTRKVVENLERHVRDWHRGN
ncbi:hypothetical protein SEA_JONJAMES_62 [Gordonia Phage JonJames]|nr:hypothetical protein SEA_JONJAMES_62 [Gordonia Phage JonJames]